MEYKPIHTLAALQEYLHAATHIAFDFETSPTEPYACCLRKIQPGIALHAAAAGRGPAYGG